MSAQASETSLEHVQKPAEAFSQFYRILRKNPLLLTLLSKATGSNYAAEVEPFSPFTKDDLLALQREILSTKGTQLVDVGCGYGSITIELSRRSNIPAIGVDIAPYAIEWANERAVTAGCSTSVRFKEGTFESTGLPDEIAGVVISVDALWLTPDKSKALSELKRILRPGGLFACFTFDFLEPPHDMPGQPSDHRPLLESAGFKVLRYEYTPRFAEGQLRYAELLSEHLQELTNVYGAMRAQAMLTHAQTRTKLLPDLWKRVYFVAEKLHA